MSSGAGVAGQGGGCGRLDKRGGPGGCTDREEKVGGVVVRFFAVNLAHGCAYTRLRLISADLCAVTQPP